jgi:PAS domain-containing protein
MDRKYVDVSEGFCKLLGYRRDELIGKKYDDLTVPHTNDTPIVFRLFTDAGYMHGIWILAHRGGTRPLIRYEAWIRPDDMFLAKIQNAFEMNSTQMGL